jgi:AcrR family transcriptional regulator
MTNTTRPDKAGARPTGRLAGAPRGPRNHEERCEEILDAAEALYVEKGRASTSIDDIAKRAKVAKGTLYHYFPDRAAMLAALRDRHSQLFVERAAKAMASCQPDDLRGKLEAWANTVVHEYISQHELLDVIYHEPSVRDRCVLRQEPVVLLLGELIELGQRQGAFRAADSLAVSVSVFYGMFGLAGDAIATGGDLGKVAPVFSKMLWQMLEPAR